jgi:hypothetical protein
MGRALANRLSDNSVGKAANKLSDRGAGFTILDVPNCPRRKPEDYTLSRAKGLIECGHS